MELTTPVTRDGTVTGRQLASVSIVGPQAIRDESHTSKLGLPMKIGRGGNHDRVLRMDSEADSDASRSSAFPVAGPWTADLLSGAGHSLDPAATDEWVVDSSHFVSAFHGRLSYPADISPFSGLPARSRSPWSRFFCWI